MTIYHLLKEINKYQLINYLKYNSILLQFQIFIFFNKFFGI